MLEIKNLYKSYGEKKVLQGIDINVANGDIYGFIGKNGAGKTTTIKSVVGINTFDKGEIIIDGMDILEKPLECKKITAYIPDNPDLYEFMTGMKYLNFVGSIFELEPERAREDIFSLANTFDLTADLNEPISSYSHGMKQKLAIISALIHKPKLLILDEPFVGLDPEATFYLKEEFKKMVQNGAAIFFSTHVLEVAQNLCNKIAILKDGKIVISGKTNEVTTNKSLENIFMELVNDKI
ncbi:ABC transporter ATP-binding protein [Peptoniphilus raoultii]|uniref:ABC transporter ATP-binding protein n=1 Tax=Peptoniphilus raoultii TaxID=1776387 RepID=UPI0008D90D89|nr:ABC transporter ATP-binding protein [Peptoniphilus raoultii]